MGVIIIDMVCAIINWVNNMTESDKFSNRLLQLLEHNNLSARHLSISLGFNEGYINRIINRKTYPNIVIFFELCDFFRITPKEFFDYEVEDPTLINELMKEIQKLDYKQTEYLRLFIKQMT